jgi:large subunit ribosomal protein L1
MDEMKRSKKYRAAVEKYDVTNIYAPVEAMKIVRETSVTKYDSTVEVSLALGVDPRKADQAIRGTVNLPHGTGKTARVLVFAGGERAEDELIDEVAKGRLDYDAVVSTPDLMGKVGRLGKVLGPRGLMPNPKTGTVTNDVTKAVNDIKGGKIEFRVDKNSNLHFIIGKASFSAEALLDNYVAAMEEVLRAKPSSSKGRYVKKATVSTTMGPGVQVDPNLLREGSV